jgi:murein L,D-transpeptidase YcbB/YkuD
MTRFSCNSVLLFGTEFTVFLRGMRFRCFLCASVLAILCLSSCGNKPAKLPQTFAELKAEGFSFDGVKVQMKAILRDPSLAGLLRYRDTLNSFYEERKFSPVWLDHFTSPGFKDRLASLYDTLFTEGLLPEWYYRDTIFDCIDLGKSGIGEELYHRLAFLEVLLSNTLVHMEHDKLLGRLPPCSEYDKCELIRKDSLPVDFIQVLHPTAFLERFSASSVPDTSYRRMRTYLANWLPDYKTDTTGHARKIPERRLRPNDTGMEVRVLAARLVVLDLISDSLARMAGALYNKDLVKAIIRYQDKAGMSADGVVGPSTWKGLYASARDKYMQIAVNMERIRWHVMPKEAPFVVVNIPEFRAWLYYPDSVSSMKVCVGKPRPLDYDAKLEQFMKTGKFMDKPLDPQTPMIESSVYSVVLNPTWSVPTNIVSREMLSIIRRDPGYLPRNGYRVYSGDREVSPWAINWNRITPGKVPYRIVQDPGDDNSLGRLKFMFVNKYSVYMHDTPQKARFKQNNRAVSHGCVRLEDPMRFAAFLLQGQKKPTPGFDDVRIWMGYPPLDSLRRVNWEKVEDKKALEKSGTYNIYLPKRVPVFFVYQTVRVDSAGKYQAMYDVYGLDEKLWKLMDRKVELGLSAAQPLAFR